MKSLKKGYQLVREQSMLLIIILVIFIAMTFASPYFLTFNNITNIIQYISVYGITAIGMTMVILTGGINLSVGGTLALSSWFAAYLMLKGTPWFLAMLAALAVGAAVGAINGFAVARVGIPPLIVTLALEQMARGAHLVFSKGKPLYGLPEGFLKVGAGKVFGIPMSVIWTIVLFIIFGLFLTHTSLGRTIYAVGGNPTATRIAGVNNSKVILFVYVIAGMLSTFAGLVLIARLDSCPVSIAKGLDMSAITGCVIGGCSVTCGGKGKIFGTFLGIIIMGLIQNALDLLNVSAYYQQFIQGVVILLAVTLDAMRNQNLLTGFRHKKA
ncbi:MAG: ABC transporter permease [Eubacteriales bacterium]|nr:ABC transporter permease [Eubacteriales bacterium]